MGASFASMRATLGLGGPPDYDLRPAQRETTASVKRMALFPKLEKCALSHGASPFKAKDPVHAAVAHLLEGRTTWDPARGPGIQSYMTMATRRVMSNDRLRPRHCHEGPFDHDEDALDRCGEGSRLLFGAGAARAQEVTLLAELSQRPAVSCDRLGHERVELTTLERKLRRAVADDDGRPDVVDEGR